jgi:hypothetical protein
LIRTHVGIAAEQNGWSGLVRDCGNDVEVASRCETGTLGHRRTSYNLSFPG